MRYISITLLLLLVYVISFGQVRSNKRERAAWVFSMGPEISIFDGRRFTPIGFGGLFEPRFIFGNMGRNASASVNMPITLTSFIQKYGIDSIVNKGFSANFPFVLDFNFYHGAYKSEKRHLGAYFGFGWSFNYISLSTARRDNDPNYDVKNNYNGLNHGLYVNAGIRVGVRSGVSFGLKAFGFLRFKMPEMSMYGIAVVYNFGMKKKSYGQGSSWY